MKGKEQPTEINRMAEALVGAFDNAWNNRDHEALEREIIEHLYDREGRGTTSVGIACGNGAGSPQRKYRGVAPQAIS